MSVLSVLNIAVPALRQSLNAGAVEVRWIVAGYSPAFGLVLVPGGSLGDVRGRKGLFLLGPSAFLVLRGRRHGYAGGHRRRRPAAAGRGRRSCQLTGDPHPSGIGGLPATGKTTLARLPAAEIGAVHLRVDTIEQALVPAQSRDVSGRR
jgi:hypothetical protein